MVHIREQEGLADTLHGDRRPVLFAVYFDAGKTCAQGRKVPVAQASANVVLKDVAEVLTILRIPWQFEARASPDAPAAACLGRARASAPGASAEARPGLCRTRLTRATRRSSAGACASCCAPRRICRTTRTCLTVRARAGLSAWA